MSASPTQRVVRFLTRPVAAVAWWAHRRATGDRAVVELVLEAVDGLADRAALIERIRRIGKDPGVVALLLEVRGTPGGWAATSDLRQVLHAIRQEGTTVIVWLEQPDNLGMWLASAADQVIVPPLADLMAVGLGAESSYLGEALERLGLEADVAAAGAYKSAAEPFTRTYGSKPAREATDALLATWQRTLEQGIAVGRNLEPSVVKAAIRQAPLTPDQARELGLIDGIAYLDEVRAKILEAVGQGGKRVPWKTWAMQDAVLCAIGRAGRPDVVAVVHLQGAIVLDDSSGRERIRARPVVELLRGLAEEASVRAVVLHVDSPGGSAFASDLIWREVERLAEAKPVVASFEDVAASGGFYLAAPAHEILVRRESITGSIGVVGGKLVVAKALRKVGVRSESRSQTPNALWLSPMAAFDADQRSRFEALLQRTYDGFVERVAKGRKRDVADIEPLCRGRVWSGEDAHAHGLVDAEGDLGDAVQRAAALAGLEVGAWRRIDLVSEPTPPLREVLMYLVRRQVPGLAKLDLARWLEPVVGASAAASLSLLHQHPAQPLALLVSSPGPRPARRRHSGSP